MLLTRDRIGHCSKNKTTTCGKGRTQQNTV